MVFCKATSGRSLVSRTDYTVGPFLNTVPVRMRLADETAASLIRRMQEQSVDAERYGILPLSEALSYRENMTCSPARK